MRTVYLYNFLLDEERLQVAQLVGAGGNQHKQLDKRPFDHAGVGGFRLVSEDGFSQSHLFLFVVDLLQFSV